MAVLTVQDISQTGVAGTLAAATATTGDTFVNDGKTFIEVYNAAVASINVTIKSQVPCNLSSLHDLVVPVAGSGTASERKKIGPFEPSRFNDATGKVTVICSSATTVTIGAFSL